MTAFRVTTTPVTRFGCFLLHAHAIRLDGERQVHLILEDVGTGAKQRFETPEALNRFLEDWGWGRGHISDSASSPRTP